MNSNEFYYFFVPVPLLCSLFSAQIFFEDYCLELNRSVIRLNVKVQLF